MDTTSLKQRSILTIVLLYLGVGAVTLSAFLWIARGVAARFSLRYAVKHAQLEQERLLEPIRREVALARAMADSEAVKAFCRRENDPRAREAGLAELEAFRKGFTDQSCFLVVAASGQYYYGDAKAPARTPVETLRPGDPGAHWCYDILTGPGDFDLHVDANVPLNVLKVWINVAVKDGPRKVGLAGSGVDLSAFLEDLSRPGDRGAATCMVDPAGILQAHPNHAYIDYNARTRDDSKRMTVYQLVDSEADRNLLRERIRRLVKGESRLETFRATVEGKRYLAAALYLKDLNWVSLTLVDQGQVLGLRSFIPLVGVLLLSALVTIALVRWLLNRMVLEPLERLTESSRAIADGDYGRVLPVERDDELGRLTRTFNHMAGTIRAHTQELEQRVAERTEALTRINRKLTDSLEYAKLVQASLLPKQALLERHLADPCVLFRPREQVGGDFYACHPAPGGVLVAVGDGTGHGVSGAFMSMSAAATLARLTRELGPHDPALLLGAMNRALKELLNQTGKAQAGAMDNGLDLGLAYVQADRLVFAGARVELWTLAPGDAEYTVHAPDPQSLGYRRSKPDYPFHNREVPLPAGTECWLFTDGILDQNGGAHNFGFGRRRLARTLLDLRGQPMAAQAQALERALDDYRGTKAQRDDITVLGFRSGPGRE